MAFEKGENYYFNKSQRNYYVHSVGGGNPLLNKTEEEEKEAEKWKKKKSINTNGVICVCELQS